MKFLLMKYRILPALLLCLGLAACHSARKAAGPADRAHSWSTLEVPVKITVDRPVDLGCSGKAMLVRDSSIYLSMRMLGMELAYIYANADSAVLCDRYHKIYISEPLERLLPDRYASIATLQALMTGLDRPDAIADKVQYSQPVETPLGNLFAQLRLCTAVAGKNIDATLFYNYGKARWDDPDFSIPSPRLPRNARRVALQDMLKQIKPH